jgi:hypothetical protein
LRSRRDGHQLQSAETARVPAWPRTIAAARPGAPIAAIPLLQFTEEMEGEPRTWRGVLRDETLAMMFEKPSMRTRVSVAAAMARHSASSSCRRSSLALVGWSKVLDIGVASGKDFAHVSVVLPADSERRCVTLTEGLEDLGIPARPAERVSSDHQPVAGTSPEPTAVFG